MAAEAPLRNKRGVPPVPLQLQQLQPEKIRKQEQKVPQQLQLKKQVQQIIESCPICLNDFTEYDPKYRVHHSEHIKSQPHICHVSCIADWFARNNTCPICRRVCKNEAKFLHDVVNVMRISTIDFFKTIELINSFKLFSAQYDKSIQPWYADYEYQVVEDFLKDNYDQESVCQRQVLQGYMNYSSLFPKEFFLETKAFQKLAECKRNDIDLNYIRNLKLQIKDYLLAKRFLKFRNGHPIYLIQNYETHPAFKHLSQNQKKFVEYIQTAYQEEARKKDAQSYLMGLRAAVLWIEENGHPE